MLTIESLPIEIQLDILEELYEDNFFAHDDQASHHLARPIDYYWSEDEEEDEPEPEPEIRTDGGEQGDPITTNGGGATQATDYSNQRRNAEPDWDVMPTDDDQDIAWRVSGIDPNGVSDPKDGVESSPNDGHQNWQVPSRVAFSGEVSQYTNDDENLFSWEKDEDGKASIASSGRGEWRDESPLRAIAFTSKHFRKLSKPLLFRTLSLTMYRRPDILHKIIRQHIVPNRHHIRNLRIDLEPEMMYLSIKRRDACKAWYDIYLSTILDRRLLPNLRSLQVFYARSYPLTRTISSVMQRVEYGDLARFGVYSKYTVGNLHSTNGFDVFTNNIALRLLYSVASHPKAATHLRHLEVHTDALLPLIYDRIRSNLTSLRTLSFRRCLWIDPPPILLSGFPFLLNENIPLVPTSYSRIVFPRISVPTEQIKWAPNDNLTTLMFYDCQNVHSGMVLWLLERYPGLREVSIATCGHDSDIQIPGAAAPKNTGDSRSAESRNFNAKNAEGYSPVNDDLSQDSSFLSGTDPDSAHPWTPPNQQVFFPSSPYGSRLVRRPLDILRVEHACLWELFALSHIPTKDLYITNAAERVVVQVFQWGLNIPSKEPNPDAEATTKADEASEGNMLENGKKAEGTQNIVEESGVDMDSDLPPIFPHLETLHVVPPRRGIRRTDQGSDSRSIIEWVDDVDGTILEDACKRRGIRVRRDAVRWRECQCHQEDYL